MVFSFVVTLKTDDPSCAAVRHRELPARSVRTNYGVEWARTADAAQGDPPEAVRMTTNSALLELVGNLARYHREHEKYYSEAGLHDAASLQSASRTLKALAEHWRSVAPVVQPAMSPYAGATDLNDERAIEGSGVLFMESGDVPAEITRIRRELQSRAAGALETGQWLGAAMDAAWGVAKALLEFPELADLLGERHSIIANDAQNAAMLRLIARQLVRADDILERVDFTTSGLRDDLAGPRLAPLYVFSASELIDQAADLAAQSAVLVHRNERAWRVFGERVDELRARSQANGGL
jgi:hypothetical protein